MRILGFFCFLFLTNIAFSQQGFVAPTCYNSSGDEFGLRIIEGKTFVLSDAKDSVGTYRKDTDAKRNFTDIFEVKGCDKELATLLKADINQLVSINSEWYDGPVSYSKKDSIFFFSNSNEGYVHGKMGIYWCKKNADGAFSTPVAFSHNSSVYSCMHPFYDDATNYLYFVSDIQNDSTGFDLYRVLFQNGKIGEVESLKSLNTPSNELFPIVFNKILYFTSNRSNGLGGMDIYSSSDLQTITLLEEPINSLFDDVSIFFTEENKGYISSNRGNTQKNGDDIYQFYIPKLKKQKTIEPNANEELLAELEQLYTKLVKENDPNSLLIEKAMQRIKEQEAQLQVLANDFGSATSRMMNYVDTASSIPFDEKVKLYEQVIAESYLVADSSSNATLADSKVSAFVTEKQKLENSSDKLALEKDFAEQKIIPFVTEDRNIDLKIIAEHLELTEQELKKLMAYAYPITFYFDFDKSLIKKEEEEKLNYLLELVQSFDGTIRLEGHTDSKGNDAYNLNLSAKRSKKVYQYLLRYGIGKEKISLVNFGETQPAADNSTVEGRALNRRVVVVLLPKAMDLDSKK
jgi:outer membrane protein OmpA-like peptidoglycan-associated protein